jgi:hypothetical protein
MKLAVFYNNSNNRKSEVYRGESGFSVVFYEHGVKIKEESYLGKSENYHRDSAENWVLGINTLH